MSEKLKAFKFWDNKYRLDIICHGLFVLTLISYWCLNIKLEK